MLSNSCPGTHLKKTINGSYKKDMTFYGECMSERRGTVPEFKDLNIKK